MVFIQRTQVAPPWSLRCELVLDNLLSLCWDIMKSLLRFADMEPCGPELSTRKFNITNLYNFHWDIILENNYVDSTLYCRAKVKSKLVFSRKYKILNFC